MFYPCVFANMSVLDGGHSFIIDAINFQRPSSRYCQQNVIDFNDIKSTMGVVRYFG